MPMIRTLIGAVALAGLVVTAAPAHADTSDVRGNRGAETRSTGSPVNPNGFGSVVSQRAIDDHDIGTHASSQSTPHLGVGNVAANDGMLFDLSGTTDTGTRPGDHATSIGALTGYDPANRPGTHE